MKLQKVYVAGAMLICALVVPPLCLSNAHAQEGTSASQRGAVTDSSVQNTDRSLNVEHDQVKTSAEHLYNSPAERAQDDLLITEVKSSLAEKGISDRYPVEVDCDHGTIELSGVVASADAARRAAMIASNTQGVIGVKNKLTWR
jgi:osmotically-inducible protein OsmY